jgi:hypothetical protein
MAPWWASRRIQLPKTPFLIVIVYLGPTLSGRANPSRRDPTALRSASEPAPHIPGWSQFRFSNDRNSLAATSNPRFAMSA